MSISKQDIEDFEEFYADSKAEVDSHIDGIIAEHEEEKQLRKLLSHGVEGGKRVRPVITMAIADVYGNARKQALDHAAIVELIHNSTLVADDYADDDEARRGVPSLWTLIERLPFVSPEGLNPRTFTILAENGMLSLALQLASDPGVVRAMGQGVQHVFKGFYLEGSTIIGGYLGGGYDKYIEINKLKTGGLFALAAWMPAIGSGHGTRAEEAARKYGENTGILYQVADDICDGDLPEFIEDEKAELEKWYQKATNQLIDMPVETERGEKLLRTAPGWCVMKMLEQEGRTDIRPGFLTDLPEFNGESGSSTGAQS